MTADTLEKARAGDPTAFRTLTEPHRRELRVHCYRMLGCLQDAEDALQDTFVAAWQGLPAFEERASLRTWLYRIATNRCLNVVRSANRRPAKSWDVPAVEPPEPTRSNEITWLEPFPDASLEGAIETLGPDARYERAESVSLAFVSALQRLPPRQLAVLVLRDVLGFHANEVAGMLDSSLESVNSALKRARENVKQPDSPVVKSMLPRPPSAVESEVASKFASAYASGNLELLTTLLTDDVFVSMPPLAHEYEGRDSVMRLFASVYRAGRRFELVPTRANGQPAFGAYLRDATGTGPAVSLIVLDLAGARIRAITRFDASVFPWFGLPASLDH